jgi:prepilin-type N-terminal cleavage/methylation domain-containing protein
MSIEAGKIPARGRYSFAEQQMVGNRKGFTLIEVLIVAVLIGTLAAIAIPRYAASKDKAFVAAMMADLHTVALYEEQFAADNHGQYFSGAATPESPLNGFTPSKDVTVTLTAFNILGSQLAYWTATAKHGKTSQSCEMRSGTIRCTTDNTVATGLISIN